MSRSIGIKTFSSEFLAKNLETEKKVYLALNKIFCLTLPIVKTSSSVFFGDRLYLKKLLFLYLNQYLCGGQLLRPLVLFSTYCHETINLQSYIPRFPIKQKRLEKCYRVPTKIYGNIVYSGFYQGGRRVKFFLNHDQYEQVRPTVKCYTQ